MAIAPLSLLFLFSLFTLSNPLPSSYISSPTTLLPNYQKMLTNFKIYAYAPPKPFTFTTQSESLFNASLFNSQFITRNPEKADLFFVPFSSDLSKRSLSRFIRDLRVEFPYWNRALAADHFYVSRAGVKFEQDRNILELKKNSVQITCFPTLSGNLIPHKDITLPEFNPSSLALPHAPVNNETGVYLGYYFLRQGRKGSNLVDQLKGDDEFLVESEPSNYVEGLGKSKFCLFLYGFDDVIEIGEALRFGCVPVVISDRPIQDLPLMDVLRWSEIAVFVGTRGGVETLKVVLGGIRYDRYERMRRFGVAAAQHLVWNESPQPYDAFHMVMYQLWLRRHAIRYAMRDSV